MRDAKLVIHNNAVVGVIYNSTIQPDLVIARQLVPGRIFKTEKEAIKWLKSFEIKKI